MSSGVPPFVPSALRRHRDRIGCLSRSYARPTGLGVIQHTVHVDLCWQARSTAKRPGRPSQGRLGDSYGLFRGIVSS